MAVSTTIQETPGLKASDIIFTSGSSATIQAPATRVFDIITDYQNYDKWNKWTPKFEFNDNKPISLGSEGNLTARMEAQNREFVIPLKIIIHSTSPEKHILAWRASFMPAWFAIAERIQVVTPIDSGSCEIKQWESTAGWGAYLLKYLMGVPKQLNEANLQYVTELKAFAESGRS